MAVLSVADKVYRKEKERERVMLIMKFEESSDKRFVGEFSILSNL